MSCITIALSTHKGGAGKTTSVACFADLLGKQGKKVLLIDTDTQGNLSKRFGYPPQPRQKVTLSDAVKNILDPQEEARPLKDFVQKTGNTNIDILPNDDRYANVVKEMLPLVMSGVNSSILLPPDTPGFSRGEEGGLTFRLFFVHCNEQLGFLIK
jgi:chromosome partitioning protein